MLVKDASSATKSYYCRAAVLTAVILTWANFGSAAILNFSPQPWDSEKNYINRNGVQLIQPAFDSLPDFAGVTAYDYIEDNYSNLAIAHSGSAEGNPQIYQHVYSYCLPGGNTAYSVNNAAGHSRTLMLTEEESNRKAGKKVTVKSDVVLDGSLLLVKEPEQSFADLSAFFEIILTQDTPKGDKKILKGSVELVGKKNGKVKIITHGNIKKSYITSITQDDNIFKIDFDDVHISYKAKVKVEEPFTLNTFVFSETVSQGAGTGAEVKFAPGGPVLPQFQENQQIPEPAMILMLLLGGTLKLARLRQRKS